MASSLAIPSAQITIFNAVTLSGFYRRKRYHNIIFELTVAFQLLSAEHTDLYQGWSEYLLRAAIGICEVSYTSSSFLRWQTPRARLGKTRNWTNTPHCSNARYLDSENVIDIWEVRIDGAKSFRPRSQCDRLKISVQHHCVHAPRVCTSEKTPAVGKSCVVWRNSLKVCRA